MTKEFLTKDEVFVVKGYLSKDAKKVVPVANQVFVDAQKHAEYIVTFAKMAKGKDFNGKKADSIEELKARVSKALSISDTEYVKKPKAVKQKLSKQLANEALNFINHQEDLSKNEKINEFLQKFNTIDRYEKIGLFFSKEDICEVEKIYTMEEIIASVKLVIDILD